MEFSRGVIVTTAHGQEVGRLDRVVIDPQTREITHIVVHKGIVLTEDRVIPVGLIDAASEESVTLREDANDQHALPNFEEARYVAANGDETEARAPAEGGRIGYLPDTPRVTTVVETERQIPEGCVALKEGAKVICCDDKQVGNIERVLTSPGTDQVTHFVVSKGLLLKENKLVPLRWVNSIEEDEVHLAVGSHLLDGLNEYLG